MKFEEIHKYVNEIKEDIKSDDEYISSIIESTISECGLVTETDAALAAAKHKARSSDDTADGVDYADVQKLYNGIKIVDRLKIKLKKGLMSKTAFRKAVNKIRYEEDSNGDYKYGNLAYMIGPEGSESIKKFLNGRKKAIDTRVANVDDVDKNLELDMSTGRIRNTRKHYDKDLIITQSGKRGIGPEGVDKEDGHVIDQNVSRSFYPRRGESREKFDAIKEKIKRHSIQNYADSVDDPVRASGHTRAVLQAAGMAGKHKHDINTDASVSFNQGPVAGTPTVKKREASSSYDETDERGKKSKSLGELTRKGRSDSKYARPTGGSQEGMMYGYPSVFASDKSAAKPGQFTNYRSATNTTTKKLDNDQIAKGIKSGAIKRIGQDSDKSGKESQHRGREDSGSRVIRTKHSLKLHD